MVCEYVRSHSDFPIRHDLNTCRHFIHPLIASPPNSIHTNDLSATIDQLCTLGMELTHLTTNGVYLNGDPATRGYYVGAPMRAFSNCFEVVESDLLLL